MNKAILSLFVLLISVCASGQEEYIIFGKGGGFAGTITSYKIYKSGKILKGKGLTEIKYTEQGKIRKKKVREIFTELDNISDTTFNCPGNMYYFIEVKASDKVKRYTWGANNFEPPEIIKRLYQENMQTLSAIQFQIIE